MDPLDLEKHLGAEPNIPILGAAEVRKHRASAITADDIKDGRNRKKYCNALDWAYDGFGKDKNKLLALAMLLDERLQAVDVAIKQHHGFLEKLGQQTNHLLDCTIPDGGAVVARLRSDVSKDKEQRDRRYAASKAQISKLQEALKSLKSKRETGSAAKVEAGNAVVNHGDRITGLEVRLAKLESTLNLRTAAGLETVREIERCNERISGLQGRLAALELVPQADVGVGLAQAGTLPGSALDATGPGPAESGVPGAVDASQGSPQLGEKLVFPVLLLNLVLVVLVAVVLAWSVASPG